jgi:membrane complex biogenesis BtpA family protein
MDRRWTVSEIGGWPCDRCALIGMVHLGALPGSHGWRTPVRALRDAALRDAEALLQGGCDAVLVENMNDAPYLRGRVRPETVAAFAVCAEAVAGLGAPMGVQVLAGAYAETLGVAVATGAAFLRVEAFAWAHVADEGWMDACAGELLRARRSLGAEVGIAADVQKKHAAHAVTADLSLTELAEGTAFCGADVLVITGQSTGRPTAAADVAQARAAGLPVWVGSGVGLSDARSLAKLADALIVGSSLKVDGDWHNPVDRDRVRALVRVLREDRAGDDGGEADPRPR